MITDTIEPVARPEPKRFNLLLHQGANAVSRGEVAEAPPPRPTATWQPVPHLRVLQTVEKSTARPWRRHNRAIPQAQSR